MTHYSDVQSDVMDEKPQINKRAPLRYILDALGSLCMCSEVDLQQVITLIEEFPCIYRVALYLQQDRYFCRIRRAVSQEKSYLWQCLIPETIFAQLHPYQYHSGQAYILPMSAVYDRIPALVPSLEIGNTQHPVDQSKQTIVLIPLITQASPLGFLAFSYMTYDQPDVDETIDLLILFARQLAAFLEQAQLQLELRRAHKERLALTNVCHAILEPEALQDLQSVYQAVYTQLKTLMPVDFFSIERYNQLQGKIIQDFKIESGEILALPENRMLPAPIFDLLWKGESGAIMFSSVDEWRHLHEQLSVGEILAYRKKNLPHPSGNIPRSGIAIVIRDAEDPIAIFTTLSYEEHSYTQQHLHILREIGTRTSLAFKNASMYSELRRALKVAQESEQLKNQFLMTASHELRTPLTAVQGYIELLNTFSETLPEETKKQFLNNAHRACEELVLLLGNVMDASRVDQDKVEMTLSPVHLIEPIHTIIEIMEPLIIREGRLIDVQIPDDLHVSADELRLRQILLNLVGNAFKYSHASPRIAIRAEALTYAQLRQRFPAIQQQTASLSTHQDYVVIAIRDWGPGITPEDQSRLFIKFMRLNKAINSTQRGAGLGLYLCRQLTEAMHGYIWMESCGIPGEGATFFVALPQSQ